MPGRGTTKSGIRVPDELWRRFGELVEAAGTTRSEVLREFLRWYVGEPGAAAPEPPKLRGL